MLLGDIAASGPSPGLLRRALDVQRNVQRDPLVSADVSHGEGRLVQPDEELTIARAVTANSRGVGVSHRPSPAMHVDSAIKTTAPDRTLTPRPAPAWNATPPAAYGGVTYTCPTHPKVLQRQGGACPKCRMAREPVTPTAGGGDNETAEAAQLQGMTRRCRVGAVLTLPVFLPVTSHLNPTFGRQAWPAGESARWRQFELATPVVVWAGRPFFVRGWRSVVNLHLSMFTLIALGVGAACRFSAVAMLLPGLMPGALYHEGKTPIYFEAVATVVVLVLLGQVLELRAHNRTGSTVKALLDLAPPTARKVDTAMRLSSVSVIANALRLRTAKL